MAHQVTADVIWTGVLVGILVAVALALVYFLLAWLLRPKRPTPLPPPQPEAVRRYYVVGGSRSGYRKE